MGSPFEQPRSRSENDLVQEMDYGLDEHDPARILRSLAALLAIQKSLLVMRSYVFDSGKNIEDAEREALNSPQALDEMTRKWVAETYELGKRLQDLAPVIADRGDALTKLAELQKEFEERVKFGNT